MLSLEAYQRVCGAIVSACHLAGRDPQSVQLLAVSKTVPADTIRELFSYGQKSFGENYIQEALDKMSVLNDLNIEWHLIGPIQSNKTAKVAEHFAWVHSLDRLKIAQRLSEQRPDSLPVLNVCVQVNLSGEESKSGVAPEEVPALALQIADLPRLRLRGLMAIPSPMDDPILQRSAYHPMQDLLADLRALGLDCDTLSMGMSADLASAIAEGATWVRVGTALFGARPEGRV